jgi:dGTPase
MLALYAANPSSSQGRKYFEKESQLRNEFQRDRDRIIHSSSFRRLQYKTQVFVNHEGDMYRSRLTHSLEVSQISRGIARSLNCHEDLVEAISLGHDLGHTPFGHAGQDALNFSMKAHGGFEHNLQSLRVVDFLENRYAEFKGLNLTFECREGILKHCALTHAKELGKIGERFIKKQQPSLEAQIVNFADEIAYCHHDLDDGYRSNILNFDQLRELPLFSKYDDEILKTYKNISLSQRLNEVLRRMMHYLINDLCQTSLANLKKYMPNSVSEVRLLPPIIGFSAACQIYFSQIKNFSRNNLYNHHRILIMTKEAKKVVAFLFNYFSEDFSRLTYDQMAADKNLSKERIIADYISGMTDRYALMLYAKLA